MAELKETVKAYLAGLTDGEGCITISECIKINHCGIKTSYLSLHPTFCIVNANKNLIESVLHDFTVGSIRKATYKNRQYKPTDIWRTEKSKEILKVIECILPYLKLKKKQALLMIEYCKSRITAPKGGHYKFTERERKITKLIKALNHKDSFMIDNNNETDKTMRAYLAGLIDGEGTIRINKTSLSGGGMSSQLFITNTSRKLLSYIQRLGSWRLYEKNHENSHWRKSYRLILERQIEVLKILKNIFPYLRLKRKQADLMIEYCKHRLTQARSIPYTERDKKIPKLLRKLNGRA